MVRQDVLERKVAAAAARLDQAEELLSSLESHSSSSNRDQDLTTFYLFLAIQECIDLAAHWVADAGWGPPDDVVATFDLLARHQVIDPSLASSMRAAVGLRNVIAHGYAALDSERLIREAPAGIESLRSFLREVTSPRTAR